jgi:hypothetical protein
MINATYHKYDDSWRHPTGKRWHFSVKGEDRSGRKLFKYHIQESVNREWSKWRILLWSSGLRFEAGTSQIRTLTTNPTKQNILDKLAVPQLVKKKVPAFYANPKFQYRIHNSLLCVPNLTQKQLSPRPPNNISVRSILILSCHLTPRPSKQSLYLRFLHQNPVCTCNTQRISWSTSNYT